MENSDDAAIDCTAHANDVKLATLCVISDAYGSVFFSFISFFSSVKYMAIITQY